MRKQTRRWLVPCAAALLTIGASMTAFAAQGWTQEEGTWVYYDSDGYMETDTWKKSGNNWYFLDEDGYLATDQIIEHDDNYYYVNEYGAMVTNNWHEVDSADYDEDDAPDTYWYYLGSNGKAYTAPSSGNTSFKTIGGGSYAFDSEGKMLFGWVNEDSERVTGDDAWKDGLYYCGKSSDGSRADTAWRLVEVVDDDNEDDDFDGNYWFYFSSNGKKNSDTTKTVNGKKYRFDENGAAVSGWYVKANATSSEAPTPSSSYIFYNGADECFMAKGWFKTVPGEEIDEDGYDDGEACWFYADSDGEIVTSQIKKINGQRYAFDENGEMLDGLYEMTLDSSNNIESYTEIDSEDEFPAADATTEVFYFGSSSKEGAMVTGKTTIEIDDEDYTYNFHKSGSSKGSGYNKIYDSCIYIQGRMLKADYDAKYEVVTYDNGEGEKDYLIGTSGKLVKNKTNIKDGDEKYYVTDSDGVVTYSGYDKSE